MKIAIKIFFILLIGTGLIHAQTAGKIAGNVFDAETGDPLIGANVVLENTQMGASVGIDGSFFILNVPPGTYDVSIQMIGYKTYKIEGLEVSVNRTSSLGNIELGAAVLESDVIVVQADKISTKKDQTSSMRAISSNEIEALPVESVEAVVNMQAGIVNGHFRGGRRNEVSYMINGIQVDEVYGGEGRTVDLEPESVQDLEVITGTFNAEYGRAMSGIVNQVVKEGSEKLSGSFSTTFGSYLTSNGGEVVRNSDGLLVNDGIFLGLNDYDPVRNQDYKFSLGGSLLPGELYFFTNTRWQDNKNHLNGYQLFNVNDYSNFDAIDPQFWYFETNGNEKYVSMNGSKNFSFLGQLTYKFTPEFKVQLMYTRNDDEWNGYNHAFKYNPLGTASSFRESDMFSLSINQTISNSMFYQAVFSYVDNYNGYYLYENPTSDKYIHDAYLTGNGTTGFFTGGQEKAHNQRTLRDYNAKIDLTWQINKTHGIKTGASFIYHQMENRESSILNVYEGLDTAGTVVFNNGKLLFPVYEPEILGPGSGVTDGYKVEPFEFAAYIQDKMELDDMVFNIGLRVDYFDPNDVYPTNRFNPDNSLPAPEFPQTEYEKAEPKIQISPRLGLSYALGERAFLYFSYGHFFQMPPLYAMYQNKTFQVDLNDDFATPVMGNTEIEPQKTVKYEIGLKQQIIEGLIADVSLYYSDVYNLQSVAIFTTYNTIRYGVHSNKDYGNTKGLEVRLDFNSGKWFSFLNYTLQYTRGSADNPFQTYSRAGQTLDPVNRLIVMSWDQRHTFNASVGYSEGFWGITLTGYYNSGTPYTWAPVNLNPLVDVNLVPNNDYTPTRVSVDLTGYYTINLDYGLGLRFELSVFNLLDELNEVWVYQRSGRAYTDIVLDTDRETHRSSFNTYDDRIENPSAYSPPRYIRLGMGITF